MARRSPQQRAHSQHNLQKLNLTQLIIAVERYNSLPQQPQSPPKDNSAEAPVTVMEWEEVDAVEDADMED